ncbi:hypothetical protein AgCh_012687 [Apium graveolens]
MVEKEKCTHVLPWPTCNHLFASKGDQSQLSFLEPQDRKLDLLGSMHVITRLHKKRSTNLSPRNQGRKELLTGEKEGLLQLPTDKSLLEYPVFRPLVDKYVVDEDAFFSDYGESHMKLSELGEVESMRTCLWTLGP